MKVETGFSVFKNTTVKFELEVLKTINYLRMLFMIDGGAPGICSVIKRVMI